MSKPFDQEFIDMMVPHHRAGIEMAKLAGERAEHPELKRFASEMVGAQESEIDQMEEWRQAWFDRKSTGGKREEGMTNKTMDHSTMPEEMDMKGTMQRLRTGDPFDKAFLKAMIPHHQMAVDMAKPAGKKADHPELKKLAQQIDEAQTREVARMKGWLADWS